jgi:hypothetical protein
MYSAYNRAPAADVQVGTPAPPPPPPRHCETACHCPTPPTHVRALFALASNVSTSPPYVASLRRHPYLFVHTSQIERIGDLLERKPEDGEVGDVWYARHISSHTRFPLTPLSSHVGLLPASNASARHFRALNLGRFGNNKKGRRPTEMPSGCAHLMRRRRSNASWLLTSRHVTPRTLPLSSRRLHAHTTWPTGR